MSVETDLFGAPLGVVFDRRENEKLKGFWGISRHKRNPHFFWTQILIKGREVALIRYFYNDPWCAHS